MKKEIIFEATEAELQTRLDSLRITYESRKAEMEDDSFWNSMGKGAKLSYMNKLKGMEADIQRLERKLERSKEPEKELDLMNAQAEEKEELAQENQEDYEEEQEEREEEKEKDKIKKKQDVEEETDLEEEIIADVIPNALSKDSLRKSIETRRQIEALISSTEDLFLDDNNMLSGEASSGLQEILTKFKEIRSLVDSSVSKEESGELTLIKIEDINSDTPPEPDLVKGNQMYSEPNSKDNRFLLKGEFDEDVTLDHITEQQIIDDIYHHYYVWDDAPGMVVIEGSMPESGKTKIIIHFGDGFLGVEPYYKKTKKKYEIEKKIANQVRKEIIDRITHGSISDTTTEL